MTLAPDWLERRNTNYDKYRKCSFDACFSLPHESKKLLPPKSCVYFVVQQGIVLYVGQSRNLYKRFVAHSKGKVFSQMIGLIVYWMEVPVDALVDAELMMIYRYNPPMNKPPNGGSRNAEQQAAARLRKLPVI